MFFPLSKAQTLRVCAYFFNYEMLPQVPFFFNLRYDIYIIFLTQNQIQMYIFHSRECASLAERFYMVGISNRIKKEPR